MPQELRWPEYRTSEAIPEVVKMLNVYTYLNSPSIISRGLQDFAIQQKWPDMNPATADLFLDGLIYLDTINDNKKVN